MLSRLANSALLVAALVASVLSGPAGPDDASASPHATDASSAGSTAGAKAGTPYQVTLITGDRVSVSATGAVTVTPDSSRRSIPFITNRDRAGHLHVLPIDAISLVGSGRLDSALFDVTALAGYRYDSRRGDLPLIIRNKPADRSAARSALTRGGAKIGRELPSVNGAAVRSRHATATAFWNQITTQATGGRRLRPEFTEVWLDRPFQLDLDQSVSAVGAPTAWAAGYDGTGAKVAVLDSGIDTTHPDLAGKVVAAANFTSEPTSEDMFGHGTHVASILAGTGTASDSRYRGVAPGASLLNGKVCIAALRDPCLESWIIAGMEWASAQDADVVNVSLGGPDSEGVDPIEAAINRLTAENGTLFVISSGNTPEGAGEYSVSTPGAADAALTVGAVDNADVLAALSNRGPRLGDSALKPDITAPGIDIMAARSSSGWFGEPGEQYVELSGTSMATPHVAGAAAILAQRHPGWQAPQLKAALMGSAVPSSQFSAFEQGAGRLDVARGYTQTVLADPPGVSFGRQAWPHGDDPILNQTLTYTNTGTDGVTVSLSLSARGPDGTPAPAGMFALSATSLELTPGASAQVTLTASTSADSPVGRYSGQVTAIGAGGVRVITPFGVDRGEEVYPVTITNINRNGEQDAWHVTRLYPLTPGNPEYIWPGDAGPVTKVVRAGDYTVESLIYDSDGTGGRLSVMANPRLRVTTERSVVFDARTAGQVDVTVNGDAQALPYAIDVAYQMAENGQVAIAGGTVMNGGSDTRIYIGQSDPNQWESGYTGKVVVTLAQGGPAGDFRNSPRSYHLAAYYPSHMPSGWSQRFSPSSLARVNTVLARHVPDTTASWGAVAYPGYGWLGAPVPQSLPFDPPFTHAAYFNTGSNLRWQPVFGEQVNSTGMSFADLEGGLNSYVPGTTTSESWNQAVFGPAHGMVADPAKWITRQGDRIAIGVVRMFGDGAGHPGWSPYITTGQLVLRRDGAVIATAQYPSLFDYAVDVPGGYATYRLEVNAQRDLPGVEMLSPRVDAAWTFKSDTMSGGTPIRLPIWGISFRPSLNASNAAPAGTTFTIPATVAVQPNSTAAALRSVNVQYSTDDGATWTTAAVTGSGGSRTVRVTHPNITGYVSLRATVTDYAGNGVEQTIIRAYRITR